MIKIKIFPAISVDRLSDVKMYLELYLRSRRYFSLERPLKGTIVLLQTAATKPEQ